jgi:hypothetical protein
MTYRDSFHRLAALVALPCALLSNGCGLVSIDGTDPNNFSGAPPETPAPTQMATACNAVDLGQGTGMLAQGPIVRQAAANNPGACAGGTVDASYVWHAPADGCYVLTYASGTVEHQINLGRNTCSGNSLGCWISYASTESFQAQSGQTLVINVSFEPSATPSDFQLAINDSCTR